MKRRLLNLLTLLSLLLCAVVLALWVRSYVVADWVRWSRIDHDARQVHYRTIQSDSGGLFLLDRRDSWTDFERCVDYYLGLEHYLREEPGRMRREMSARGPTSGYPQPAPVLGRTGFRYSRSARTTRTDRQTEWSAVVPYWSLALASVLLPAARLPSALRRRRRRRLALCARCGFDLRATPDRCPECGTIPATTART